MTLELFASGTLAPAATSAILSSVTGSPIQINTSAAHGFSDGDRVLIQNHEVNTAANGEWIIVVVDSDSFTLTGSTGNGTGGATGFAAKEHFLSSPAVKGRFKLVVDLFNVIGTLDVRIWQKVLTSGTVRPSRFMSFSAGSISNERVITDFEDIWNDLEESNALRFSMRYMSSAGSPSLPWKILREYDDNDLTLTELPQLALPATPTLKQAIMAMFMALRNRVDVDATNKKFYNDAGTVIHKKVLSDDGTTYSEAESVTGP